MWDSAIKATINVMRFFSVAEVTKDEKLLIDESKFLNKNALEFYSGTQKGSKTEYNTDAGVVVIMAFD